MQPGKIVFQGKVKELELIVRYPTMDDVEVLRNFINAASAERTFIRLQGESFTFEEEAQYLEGALDQIKNLDLLKLMVFDKDELAAVGDITRQPIASTKHLGRLGIIVSQKYRGAGIGRKLMELLLAESKNQLPGVELIILSVYQQNKIARSLYQSLGFKEYGRLPKGRKRGSDYDDEIEMFVPLKTNS